ncbi:hypothetical protein HMI54_006898 [Coelomomyces lativittatus]|nr:hypothetical protein HMI56_003589 [Coelomomyces lativittatus]KAJ1504537.1 hypothetical protein HMI54_006898 [Coelomomyces lativittatus]
MGKGERSLNPVDTFRKELKRKEIKKAKLTKELQKKQDDEERDKYDAFLAEFNRLTEEASKRSLTAIEKSKRKELKQYLASNSRFSQDEAASKRRKLGHDLPSGLYDPLSEEHQLMYGIGSFFTLCYYMYSKYTASILFFKIYLEEEVECALLNC